MGPFMGRLQSEGLGWRDPCAAQGMAVPGAGRRRKAAFSSSHAGSRMPPTPSLAAGKEPAVLVQMPPSLFFSYNYVSEG